MQLTNCLLIFLILFISQTVRSIQVADIYQIESIEKFIDDIDKKAITYELDNQSLSKERANEIMMIMRDDLASALDELNNITSVWTYQYENDLSRYVIKLESHCMKNDLCEWAYLSTGFSRVTDKYQKINDNVLLLLKMYKSNTFSQDLTRYCTLLSQYIHFSNIGYESSLITHYWHFINDAIELVNKTDKRIFQNDSSVTIRTEVKHFYRKIIITYLKEFTIFYFADMANQLCLKRKPDNFLSRGKEKMLHQFENNIKDTERLLHMIQN